MLTEYRFYDIEKYCFREHLEQILIRDVAIDVMLFMVDKINILICSDEGGDQPQCAAHSPSVV